MIIESTLADEREARSRGEIEGGRQIELDRFILGTKTRLFVNGHCDARIEISR
ncbi:MAG: hypothetical protein ACE5OZ_18180 [Candidatus Heimdallarchaeota archaeon]